MSNGQVCEVRFYLNDDAADYDEFSVAFAVANKKKYLSAWFERTASGKSIDLKITGTAGMEALIWCKDQILLFENEVQEQFEDFYRDHPQHEIHIVIGADDAKRFRAYRYMKRYGYFETTTAAFGRSLIKKFKPERRRCG